MDTRDGTPIYNGTITVFDENDNPIATGTLAVNSNPPPGPPQSATFTPTGSQLPPIPCNGVAWPTTRTPGLPANFNFQISGQANNGSFPPGPYNFNGQQNSNGCPSGGINFPSAVAGVGDADDDTWQATAVPEEVEDAETKRKGTYGATAS